MVGNSKLEVQPQGPGGWFRRCVRATVFSCIVALALSCRAALQFDVFPGFDSVVPEANWFPVVCEINNDGPSFVGTIEVTAGNLNQGQTRRVTVELPTGTTKRLVIPVFSTSRGYSSWDVRLYDERGKVRGEQLNLRARKQLAADAVLIGALSRTPGGTPGLPPILAQQSDLQPGSARLLPAIFPDNPLVLEGMSVLYLNSEKISDLRSTQVAALMHWLNAGGHLIIGVEQAADINAAAWLKNAFPCDLTELQSLPRHPELQAWLKTPASQTNLTRVIRNRNYQNGRQPVEPPVGVSEENPFGNLADDFNFETAPMQVTGAKLRDGQTVVAVDNTPLIITANRGRGQLTVLLFSPEREPFRSWKNQPQFWAKMAEVPGMLYASSEVVQAGGWSSDGIFGAMVDSRQVHKLPVGWLLLLLIVYLVVIGPLDQYWLKRIGKPMLTWITFPCYVVLFSLLIYFIGYKLRAGESEWNELHIVDVLPNGERAELRGRTYASVYSPANQKYQLESQQKYATLRGEFAGSWGGGQSGEKGIIAQNGDSFKAEIFVPVWTSQLLVNDWWQSSDLPLNVTVKRQGDGWFVKVQNLRDHKLTSTHLAVAGNLIPLGEIPAKETKTFTVTASQGQPIRDFVAQHGSSFQNAVQSRQRAFGGSGQIDDRPNGSMAACFISQMSRQNNYMEFLEPRGLDLSPQVGRGEAVVLAFDSDYSPVKPIYQFTPRRAHRDTLWRIAVQPN